MLLEQQELLRLAFLAIRSGLHRSSMSMSMMAAMGPLTRMAGCETTRVYWSRAVLLLLLAMPDTPGRTGG